jgi:hypothetical protein
LREAKLVSNPNKILTVPKAWPVKHKSQKPTSNIQTCHERSIYA